MAAKGYCGKSECAECKRDCDLDGNIPCSPDCRNLDGEKINLKRCLAEECEEIGFIFARKALKYVTDEERKEMIGQYGEIAEYPYSL